MHVRTTAKPVIDAFLVTYSRR